MNSLSTIGDFLVLAQKLTLEDAVVIHKERKAAEAERKARALMSLGGHGTKRKKPLLFASKRAGRPRITFWTSRSFHVSLIAA